MTERTDMEGREATEAHQRLLDECRTDIEAVYRDAVADGMKDVCVLVCATRDDEAREIAEKLQSIRTGKRGWFEPEAESPRTPFVIIPQPLAPILDVLRAYYPGMRFNPAQVPVDWYPVFVLQGGLLSAGLRRPDAPPERTH